ncbi:unnamed protein product [Ambrosiozyma monospora]|uniref:Unnamed protein product n=1 Tax=Ambrosiozyma monospora TaxID=43982 RepID=A0A9W6YWK2_AMBMO|nr:unnamed protein product [Ambrosiozyma monospora]
MTEAFLPMNDLSLSLDTHDTSTLSNIDPLTPTLKQHSSISTSSTSTRTLANSTYNTPYTLDPLKQQHNNNISYNSPSMKTNNRLVSEFNDTLSTIAVENCFDSSIDISPSPSPSFASPLLMQLQNDQPFSSHTQRQKQQQQQQQQSTSALNSPSFNPTDLDTPCLQLNLNDLTGGAGSRLSSSSSTSSHKESFPRIKQVKEMLNTEDIYLKSLSALKTTYIDNIMHYETTPLFIKEFDNCVQLLIQEHGQLRDRMRTVYRKLIDNYNCVSSVPSSPTIAVGSGSDADSSPSLSNFHLQPNVNEEKYLLEFIEILRNAINVNVYCRYCSLFQKITAFTEGKDVERFKRESIRIEGEFVVTDMTGGLINGVPVNPLDPRIDSRFISLIQMPTTRPARYALMLGSLRDKYSEGLSASYFERAGKIFCEITDNVSRIDNFMKLTELNCGKNQLFKKMSKNWFNKNERDVFPYPVFVENLDDLVMAGAFQLCWKENETFRTEHLSCFLFNTHLIFGKLNKNSVLEIKFIIPIKAIVNDSEFQVVPTPPVDSGFLYTKFPFKLNIQFEDDFKLYEVLCVFASAFEMELWKNKIMTKLNKLHLKPFTTPFAYTKEKNNKINSDSISPTDKNAAFEYTCYTPAMLNFYKMHRELRRPSIEQQHQARPPFPHRRNNTYPICKEPDEQASQVIIVLVKHFICKANADAQQRMASSRDIPDSKLKRSASSTSYSSLSLKNKSQQFDIEVKHSDRAYYQKQMAELWSTELPKVEESLTLARSFSDIKLFSSFHSSSFSSSVSSSSLSTSNTITNTTYTTPSTSCNSISSSATSSSRSYSYGTPSMLQTASLPPTIQLTTATPTSTINPNSFSNTQTTPQQQRLQSVTGSLHHTLGASNLISPPSLTSNAGSKSAGSSPVPRTVTKFDSLVEAAGGVDVITETEDEGNSWSPLAPPPFGGSHQSKKSSRPSSRHASFSLHRSKTNTRSSPNLQMNANGNGGDVESLVSHGSTSSAASTVSTLKKKFSLRKLCKNFSTSSLIH